MGITIFKYIYHVTAMEFQHGHIYILIRWKENSKFTYNKFSVTV